MLKYLLHKVKLEVFIGKVVVEAKNARGHQQHQHNRNINRGTKEHFFSATSAFITGDTHYEWLLGQTT